MSKEYTVLLADDSAFAQKVVASYLAGTEFKVVASAKTGGDAVVQFKAHSPEIVVLDVILPDLEGPEVLKQIMAISPTTKVLMVSSLGKEDTVTECLTAGAKSFVQKPVDKETLLARMRALVTE
ncbi:MAG: response regulator [Kiritimatiellae bacterium]|nr:response regulator [Kiritimatiellia bacterium]